MNQAARLCGRLSNDYENVHRYLGAERKCGFDDIFFCKKKSIVLIVLLFIWLWVRWGAKPSFGGTWQEIAYLTQDFPGLLAI